VGPAHLEFLGSLEGVAAAKAEMLDFLRGERVSILNGDDPTLDPDRKVSRTMPHLRSLLSMGFLGGRDFRQEKRASSSYSIMEQKHSRASSPVGRHSVYNALASTAIAVRCGLQPGRDSGRFRSDPSASYAMRRFSSPGE